MDVRTREEAIAWGQAMIEELQIAEKEACFPDYGQVNVAKMLHSAVTQMECLLEPIIPKVGLVSLVGSSDCGKSTLLRGLCMAICAGEKEYIGFKINAKYHRAIYISTEDDVHSISAIVNKQNQELNYPIEKLRSLSYIFEVEDIVKTLNNFLSYLSHDVVVIDAFADIYHGSMNENNQVRKFLQKLKELADFYQVLIIVLHHTGKRTEQLSPSKHNAIGSQGFEAKMRLMMELRKDLEDPHKRHLCIVKGNYLPAEYKHSSYVLHFSDNLNYTATSERVPFEQLRECNEELDAQKELLRAIWRLHREGKKQKQIASEVGVSQSSVSRAISKIKDMAEDDDELPF